MEQSKILVVDDDPDIIEAITTVLESMDEYDVRTARDGLECMEAVKEDPPDLIILDLLMPRMDGFAVVRELREKPHYGKLPIMILTSVREDASYRRYELETGLSMDVQDYIEKPVPPAELLRRVGKLLKRG
ncbi:MAG: response regulator [Anaerolineae bacterium]|jgi:CheY-like chemotaxis protein|nr:response regulator [Anaerolineae bacterium]